MNRHFEALAAGIIAALIFTVVMIALLDLSSLLLIVGAIWFWRHL